MSILQHLEELRQRVFKILWVVMPLFVFYMSFTIRVQPYLGVPWPYPWPEFYNSISVMVIRGFMDSLLPVFVERVQLNPWEAIVTQFKVSLFLAVLTAMPWIVYQLAKFVAPGLYEREKRIILKITVPGTLLFVGGVLVAQLVILPFAFDFLYGIGVNMGLAPLVGPEQFFDIVLLFFVGMGLAFQTPVIMWGLGALGIIGPDFWKRNWRYATIAFFLFGAFITPDGSGITMFLVAVPMSLLYVGGYLMSRRAWSRREGQEPPERGGRSAVAVWSVVAVVVVASVGGFLYFNQGLLAPPLARADTLLTTGNVTLQVPGFVLYSASPFAPGVRTGSVLEASNETPVILLWSGTSDEGLEVTFEAEEPASSALHVSAPDELTLLPALWESPDNDELVLSASNGDSLVYMLGLNLGYSLLLRKEFSDANRNSLLDPGEAVQGESYVVSYSASPGSTDSVELSESGIRPPDPGQLMKLRSGIFSSTSPDWRLEATASELLDPNQTYTFAAGVEDETLDAYGIHLFMTRSSSWTHAEGLTSWVSGDFASEFTFTFYVDLRFGAIFTVLSES